MKEKSEFDVIIIGGGPAGLSCALLLARSRRSVIVFDEGLPRNRRSNSMNGFISRDGINPLDFLHLARTELLSYEVLVVKKKILNAEKQKNYFQIESEEGKFYKSKKLVLATGVKDNLPPIRGIEEFFGISVFHCPYCDGWENRDKRIGVIGKQKRGVGLALSLINWSKDVILLTNGKNDITEKDKSRLKKANIKVNHNEIRCLHGKGGKLEAVEFDDGTVCKMDALFFSFGYKQQSDISRQLDCEFTKNGDVKTDIHQETNVPGFYVVGDASRDMQLVIVAASEGTKAGVAINTELSRESLKA